MTAQILEIKKRSLKNIVSVEELFVVYQVCPLYELYTVFFQKLMERGKLTIRFESRKILKF